MWEGRGGHETAVDQVVGEGRGGHWTGKTAADFRVVVGEGSGGHWTGKTTADFRVVVGEGEVDIGQVRLLLISG